LKTPPSGLKSGNFARKKSNYALSGGAYANAAKGKMRPGRSNVAQNRLAKSRPAGVHANNKRNGAKLCENSDISSWLCANKKTSSGVWPDKACENE